MYIYRMIAFFVKVEPEVLVMSSTGRIDLNRFCDENKLEFMSFTKTPLNDPIHNSSIAIGIFKKKGDFNYSKELNREIWG